MSEHYFTEKPTSELRLRKISVFVKGINLYLNTAAGVFSPDYIDNGTKLLIENAIIKDSWKILDLGCGYGVVGIALKKLFPKADFVLSDINERALKLAKMNSKLNKTEIKIIKSNSFDSIKENFDSVLLNPPQTAGKDICFEMIENSFEHLNIKGLLQIVARHNKGGSTFEKKMKEVFGNVKEISKKSGYRIYVSEKN
jgi:16S rRNA G1207 methylase RsmC